MQSTSVALLMLLVCAGCTDGRSQREQQEREQLARFAKGEIFQDSELPPPAPGRDFAECLRVLAPLLGRGVCVPLAVARPDGAHEAPRWGQWTYEYVKTTPKKSPDGKTVNSFTDIESSSLGLEAQGEYDSDRPAGGWRFWHPNGKPRASGSFANGKMSGAWEFWLADGTPDAQNSGVYVDGARVPAAGR